MLRIVVKSCCNSLVAEGLSHDSNLGAKTFDRDETFGCWQWAEFVGPWFDLRNRIRVVVKPLQNTEAFSPLRQHCPTPIFGLVCLLERREYTDHCSQISSTDLMTLRYEGDAEI
jgi:hypothetical protein